MLIRLVTCAAMAVARLAELALSRANLSARRDYREGKWSRRTFPMIVAIHVCVIGGTALCGRRVRLRWLLILAAAQPLRAWTLLTLGLRWNARGAVSSSLEVETSGPYGYIRHPNYLVVIVELLALPLAFGLRRFALVMLVPHAIALAIRVRDEESLLNQLPGYRRHFAGKARFIPHLL